MFLYSFLIAAGLLVAETPDTLQAVTIVADKGVVVSRADTLVLHADGTVSQALLRVPGLSISDYGGLAGLKSVSLRGLGTAHTDIYLDGVRVSNFQSGQNDLGMLPLETLGSAVVDYAQNSVSFRTARPVFDKHPVAGRVGVQGGSFGTLIPSARFDARLSKWLSLSAHGAGIISKGNFPYGESGAKRTGNDIKQIHGGLDLFGTMHQGEWQAKAYYNTSDRGTPGSLSWPSEDRQKDQNILVQGTLSKTFANLYTLNVSAKGAYDKLFYHSSWGESNYDFKDFQFNSSHTFRLTDWWGASLAADLERGSLKASDYEASRTAAIGALATAIRLKRFQADLAVEYRGTFDKGAAALHSISPSLDLRLTLFKGFDLVAFGRRAFRAPTFNELYYPGYGNPKLRPEDAWLTDVGFDWHHAVGEGWMMAAKFNFFYNLLKDKIISAPSADDPYVWLPYNIGKVQAKGTDVSLAARYDNGSNSGGLSVRYAWQSALDKTPDSYTFDQQIPYVARHTVVVAADMAKTDCFRLDILFNWRGGRFDASGEMPSWHTLDLSVTRYFVIPKLGRIGLSITVKDLTNCRYELVRDYPMPGRALYGGVEFKF